MQCRSLRIPFRSTRIRSTVSTPDVERGPEGSMLPCPAEAKPLARSASLRGRCFGFIDLDDPAAACVEDLPEDVVHVRALGRVMRFGLLEASVRGGLPTVRRSISRPSSCRPPPIRVGANARRARRRDGRMRRTPARMRRSDRTPRRRGRIVHLTLPKVPSVPFSSLLRSGEANRTFCGPSPPVRRKALPRPSRPSGTRRRCASRPLIRIT